MPGQWNCVHAPCRRRSLWEGLSAWLPARCSEEKAARAQQPQHTAAAGVVACAGRHRSTVPPSSGDQLTYWQSPRPQIYHGLHQATSVPLKDCGDPDGGPAQECGCSALRLQGVPEPADAGEGGRNSTCVRGEQVEDLLSMVAELKEEVQRLRTIREREQEIDWWSNSQACQRGTRQGDTPQKVGDGPHVLSLSGRERGPERRGELEEDSPSSASWARHCKYKGR